MSEEEKEDRQVVIDGVVQYTSVSALQKHSSCPRSWWYKYVARLPDKLKSAGLVRGTEGHERLAHYLTTGQDVLDPLERLGVTRGYVPKIDPLTVAGQPPRGLPEGAKIEHSIEGVATAGPIPMKGSIDLYVPARGDSEARATVRDWKFKADIGRWACRAEDLIDPDNDAGIQMIGYAAYAVQQGAEIVDVSHVTFQTRGRADVSLTAATISQKEVAEKWASVVNRIVPELLNTAKAADAEGTRANYDVCEKYGGCAFKDTCLSRSARLRGGFAKYLKENTMPIVKSLPIQTAAPAPTPQGAVTAAPAAPVAPTQTAAPAAPAAPTPQGAVTASAAEAGKGYLLPSGAVGTFICAVQTAAGAKYAFGVPNGRPEQIDPDTVIYPTAAPPPAMILPPDAPVSAPKRQMPIIDEEPTPPAPGAPPPPPPPVAPSPAPVEIAAPPPQAEPKKPRKPKIDAPAPVTQAEAPAPAPAAPATQGVHLYFGCSPVGVVTSTLHAYVEDLERQVIDVAAKHGASTLQVGDDLRTADDKALGFGKWKGYLAAAAKVKAPPPGHYLVDRVDERIDCVADALMGVLPAGAVVRGGR